MAKYVCDYGQVTAIGNKLIENSNTLVDAANSYSSSIEGSLSSWSGAAKNSFSSQSSAEVDKVKAKADEMKAFGEFIINAAKSIQELDEELANVRI